MCAEGDPKFYAEDEIDRYSEEFHLNEKELETNFTSDAKSCQPDCDEQFPILRPKEQNEALIEHYLLNQPKELIDYIKQLDFQYTETTDNEMTLLIDKLIDSKDVYSLHKFDVGKTRQKFHVTLKPNVELKRQRMSKVPLHLKDIFEKLLTQLRDADIIREMGDDDEIGSLFVNRIILMPKKRLRQTSDWCSLPELNNRPHNLLLAAGTSSNDHDKSERKVLLSQRFVLCLPSGTPQASSTVDDNIFSPKASTVCVAYQTSTVD